MSPDPKAQRLAWVERGNRRERIRERKKKDE